MNYYRYAGLPEVPEKPRISYCRKLQCWVCCLAGAVWGIGEGRTPAGAYASWKFWRRLDNA